MVGADMLALVIDWERCGGGVGTRDIDESETDVYGMNESGYCVGGVDETGLRAGRWSWKECRKEAKE